MNPTAASESTPLVGAAAYDKDAPADGTPSPQSPAMSSSSSSTSPSSLSSSSPLTSFSVLLEIIGGRNLPVGNLMEPYCVVQFGPRAVHRTKPVSPRITRHDRLGRLVEWFGGSGNGNGGSVNKNGDGNATNTVLTKLQRQLDNPVWTVHEDSVFSLTVLSKDVDNKKTLVVTVWARPRGRGRSTSTSSNTDKMSAKEQPHMSIEATNKQYKFIGKIRIPAETLMNHACSEERLELPLMDDLGRTIHGNGFGASFQALLAVRCRMASKADIAFAENWPTMAGTKKINELWAKADVHQDLDRPQATLITETPDQLIQGASLTAALAASIGPLPTGKVVVKPYPDPVVLAKHKNKKNISSLIQCMTPQELKNQVDLASRNWIQAGSKTSSSFGRLYVEVLSAKDLPNVDIGSTVGNQTDSFVSFVYGDVMVSTDVIDDELSPIWLPWTKRAFIFPMNHPSQVIFLSVFGYKRNPMQHSAIGRVEINPTNMQNHTQYDLQYPLLSSSHTTSRTANGSIRLRIRLEIDDERKYLLAALQPSSNLYINCQRKKTLQVARFTARGEFDNGDTFNLAVLQGYIDELLEGYLRRVIYSLQDGLTSLVFWKSQAFGFPLYSLLVFVMSVAMVEHPVLIPGMLCLFAALFMLALMRTRMRSPIPFRRCFGFWHYLRILLLGRSARSFQRIDVNDGFEEQRNIEKTSKIRRERDQEFFHLKEAVEKQIEELEKSSVETKSKIIPLEVLAELGKVQGIVGNVCRVLRFIDTILTWEESYLSFFITLSFLVAGLIFLFVPWGVLFKWTGRFLVLVLFGPQNKILDFAYVRHISTNEQRIRKLLRKRMFEARVVQEDNKKEKAFRNALFGKYSTAVPSIYWTRHHDFPLPSSYARHGPAEYLSRAEDVDKLPFVRGQLLKGVMIPRPVEAWRRNEAESSKRKSEYKKSLKQNNGKMFDHDENTDLVQNPSGPLDQGFEVTDLYDEERGYVQNVLREESTTELGVEILQNGNRAFKFESAFRSVHDFDDVDGDDDDSSTGPDPKPEGIIVPSNLSKEDVDLTDTLTDWPCGGENGVEITEAFDLEAKFVQQSWRGELPRSFQYQHETGPSGMEPANEDAVESRTEAKLLRNEEWISEADSAAERGAFTDSEAATGNNTPRMGHDAMVRMASKRDQGFEVIE